MNKKFQLNEPFMYVGVWTFNDILILYTIFLIATHRTLTCFPFRYKEVFDRLSLGLP